jgi:hypothetical protein
MHKLVMVDWETDEAIKLLLGSVCATCTFAVDEGIGKEPRKWVCTVTLDKKKWNDWCDTYTNKDIPF